MIRIAAPSTLALLLLARAVAPGASSPVPPVSGECRPAAGDASEALRRAARTVGLPAPGGPVLHFHSMRSTAQTYQSDRWYPPYFDLMNGEETWYDPGARLERRSATTVYPSTGPGAPGTILAGERATYAVRDTGLVAFAPAHESMSRVGPLNPWWVIGTWSAAEDVRVAEECRYRDRWRLVLAREADGVEERLFLDRETAFPVKVEREEPHYLWGQQRVEYLYSTWHAVEGGGFYPTASFRLADGVEEMSRTVGKLEVVDRGSAPPLALPAGAPDMRRPAVADLPSETPDTVRVGPRTWLLVNRAYTETVTLQGDTVYLLDATLGSQRAAQDSVWIERLFGGGRPVVVVVTDLAWPHIAGVRSWVARGATIVSHADSRPFLEQVVAREWTREPDLLERRRASAPLRFVAVEDSLALAGGAIRLHGIDGVGSEGALMAYLPGDDFLWASDYIQSVREPSLYAAEVVRAARRVGIRPERTAAQHLPLTPWSVVEGVVGEAGGAR